jgi:hypothetical protein
MSCIKSITAEEVWDFHSSADADMCFLMWCHVRWQIGDNLSEGFAAFFFRVYAVIFLELECG